MITVLKETEVTFCHLSSIHRNASAQFSSLSISVEKIGNCAHVFLSIRVVYLLRYCSVSVCVFLQLFAYMAFAVAVIWIYITANEIVNLLQVLCVGLIRYFYFMKMLLLMKN